MSAKLYMIPGTGTDHRMYLPQLERFPDMVIPEWLPPLKRKEPITSYAKRLSAQIDTSQPFLLGGTSLGGMIAQEMAKSINPLGLILISTCNSYKALPLVWRISGKITRLSPDILVKLWLKFLSFIVSFADKNKFPYKNDYTNMIAEISPSLIRWQSGAATEWSLKGSLTVPIFHIHGGKDKVVPLKNVIKFGKTPERIIENGGHLINVTHAAAVNDFIASCIKH
jgi:pimeloyl-ACP methyl ester carboxylesterase